MAERSAWISATCFLASVTSRSTSFFFCSSSGSFMEMALGISCLGGMWAPTSSTVR